LGGLVVKIIHKKHLNLCILSEFLDYERFKVMNVEIVNYITIGISIVALLFSFFTWKMRRKDKIDEQAPNLMLKSLIFNGDFTKRSFLDQDSGLFPQSQKMRLTRVSYVDGNPTEKLCEKMLILNVSKTDNTKLETIVNFDTFYLINTGFDLVSFKINKLYLKWDDNSEMTLEADKEINSITEYVANGEIFSFGVSFCYTNNTMPFHFKKTNSDKDYLENSYIVQKIENTKGELLNTYFSKMADKILEYKITVELTNKYNKHYIQDIYLSCGANTTFVYTTKSSKPNLPNQNLLIFNEPYEID
jgi:hypothetical protein